MFLIQVLSVLLISNSALIYGQDDSEEDLTYALAFQDDGLKSDETYAKLLDPIPELKEFTICVWVKFEFQRMYNQIWSYCALVPTANGLGKRLICSELFVEPPGSFTMGIADKPIKVNITGKFQQYQWNLYCGAYQTQGQNAMRAAIYFNGEKLIDQEVAYEAKMNCLHGDGVWILGQDQDSLGGRFEEEQSFSGYISHFNVWDSVLNDFEMKQISNCQYTNPGTVVAWNGTDTDWEMNRISEESLEATEFCEKVSDRSFYLMPENRSVEDAAFLCTSLGANMFTPSTKSENKIVRSLSRRFRGNCTSRKTGKTTWLAIERGVNNSWVDVNTKEVLPYQNWKPGQGKGRTNCAYMLMSRTKNGTDNGKWGAALCSDESQRYACTVCEFSSFKPVFYLRGLCRKSKQDRIYTLEKDKNRKPYFKGRRTSLIKWNATGLYWDLNNLNDKGRAFLEDPTEVEYPNGRMEWVVKERRCKAPLGKPMMLTLTSCNETQFTCDDGTCIDLHSRCDRQNDCDDKSDEDSCYKVVFANDYDDSLPPKETDDFGKKIDAPLPIYMNIDLITFSKIDTKHMRISVQLRVNLTWFERRLRFLNLRDDIFENMIDFDERERMWLPEIGFFNARTGFLKKDEFSVLMARKDTEPDLPDYAMTKENYVYNGFKNPVMLIQRYFAEYPCEFNLRFFPFDEQYCVIDFKAEANTNKSLILVPAKIRYLGASDMVEFTVVNVTFGAGRANKSRSEARVKIHFKRQYAYHISQSFFQSWLLGFLSYLTFYIDISDFSDRFMGAMTALLVLASLMSALAMEVPKTSYFKVIDFWLLYFLISTVGICAVHMVIDHYFTEEEKKKKLIGNDALSEVFEKRGKGVSLAVGGLANAAYIGAGIALDDNEEEDLTRMAKARMWFKGLTARKINNFQKFSFPASFIFFTVFYSLSAHYKVGDVDVDALASTITDE